jgi:hypothetical protein
LRGRELKLRLTLVAPPAGVLFSLQDARSQPVDAAMADGRDLSLDLTVRMDEGPSGPVWLGPFVRNSERGRFVYFASGAQAGQAETLWSRRGKVMLATLPVELAREAVESGRRLEARVQGTGRDGGPACATVKLLDGWRAVEG